MPDTIEAAVPFLSVREIEARSAQVLQRHGLTTVPVDPLAIARCESIPVQNARFDDQNIAGMIVRRGSDVAVLINRADPPFRKRFTIAHELGHHFLHLDSDGEFVDAEVNLFRRQTEEANGSGTSPERRREIQANLFAASLLMPEAEVRRYWHERRSIEDLARIFNVSAEAMGYRVDALGLD